MARVASPRPASSARARQVSSAARAASAAADAARTAPSASSSSRWRSSSSARGSPSPSRSTSSLFVVASAASAFRAASSRAASWIPRASDALGAGGRLLEGGGRSRGRSFLRVPRRALGRPRLRERAVGRGDLGGGAGARDALDDPVAHRARLAGDQLAPELVRHLGMLGDVQGGFGFGANGLGGFERRRRRVERGARRRRCSREALLSGTGCLHLLRGGLGGGRRLLDGPRFVIQLLDQCREGLEGGVSADALRDRLQLGAGDLPGVVGRRHLLLGEPDRVVGRRRVVGNLLESLRRWERCGRRLQLRRPGPSLSRFPERDVACLREHVEPRTGRVEVRVSRRGRLGLGPCLIQARTSLVQPGALSRERLELELGAADPVFRRRQGGIEPLVAEHALQHGVALGRRRLQELREPVLREQHRAAEGVEGHPQQPLDPLPHRPLLQDRLQHLRVVARPSRGARAGAGSGPRRRSARWARQICPSTSNTQLDVRSRPRAGGSAIACRARTTASCRRARRRRRRGSWTSRRRSARRRPTSRRPRKSNVVRPRYERNPCDRQLTRTHRPPPRAPRGTVRAGPRAAPRRCPAGQ